LPGQPDATLVASPPSDFPVEWPDPQDELLTWEFDDMHMPFALPPLSIDYARTLASGFNPPYEAWGLPNRIYLRIFHSYGYFAFDPGVSSTEEAEADRQRREVFRDFSLTLESHWRDELLPEIQRIERHMRDQRELLAGVSHEIRSPLARLRVLAELLQGGAPSPHLHAKIEQEVAEIDDLVGKLLASSRLDFGALEVSALCARDLALRALERAGLAADLLHDSSQDAAVRGDATLLARALGNLLENAQHHAGGVTALTLRADARTVYFEVYDAGPGLSTETLAHGFDPFFRGAEDGQTSSRGALGLGLSLVRRIARAHGGDALIENRPNQPGAVATLSLPRASDSASVSAEAKAAT